MLATLGDLVDGVVVMIDDPINVAPDTAARMQRRGGSLMSARMRSDF